MTDKFQTAAEWPTLVLVAMCYTVFFGAAMWVNPINMPIASILMVLAVVLQSSLTHEMLHGHPFKSKIANAAMVFPAIGIFVPYLRFKDTHLAHHINEHLTDPYDDPETNYLDPAVWPTLSRSMQITLRINNTLLGRMILGPIISQSVFMMEDARAIIKGNRRVALGWALHIPAVLCVWVVLAGLSDVSMWQWIGVAYLGMGILKIRTFLEHRAHQDVSGRTVIVEDRGALAFLFLNNNYHALHHAQPCIPWFDLPRIYAQRKAQVLRDNDGYHFANYRQIFAKYLLRAKDPVVHPLWPKGKSWRN